MGLFSSIGNAVSSIFNNDAVNAIGNLTGQSWMQDWAGQDIKEAENKKAYERQIALWSMNNAYNSPVQQMQRLKAAGLNPNLVYGSGSVVGNSSSAASGNFDAGYVSSKRRAMDDLLDRQRLTANDATIENTRAETRNLGAAFLSALAEYDNKMLDNDIKRYNLEVAKKTGQPVGDNGIVSQVLRLFEPNKSGMPSLPYKVGKNTYDNLSKFYTFLWESLF